MTTAVVFRQFRTNDFSAPLTLEEIFMRYGAWAGIHDFNFDVLAGSASATVSGVTAGGWEMQAHAGSLPANFVVKYHKTDLRQGIFFADDASFIIVVGTDSNGYPRISYANSTVVQSIPKATPEEADVEVVFRQQTFDDVNPVIWRSITLYMNGKWITTFSDQVTEALTNIQYGFCAWEGDNISYTNIEVPELCDTAEFGTLDPGEAALGGLQRTIEGRYLKFFARYNGALRAWKRKQRSRALILEDDIQGIKRSYDLPQLITHARMMGAFIWSEDKDDDLIRLYGHRFQEVNNAMLLTQPECLEEAGNTIKRSEESTFSITAQARHIPTLEPEDRIQIDGEEWVIDNYSYSGSYGRLVQTYNCRKYVWG